MTVQARFASVACIAALAVPAISWAGPGDFGKREYESNCANCHGVKGQGDGDYKPYLSKSPADLTTLARSNKGVFPYDRMYQVVDGRKQLPAHGRRDMPIWGDDYLAKARSDYTDVAYDQEAYVRTRIEALLDYVHRLQAR